jgi:hypothetical protein
MSLVPFISLQADGCLMGQGRSSLCLGQFHALWLLRAAYLLVTALSPRTRLWLRRVVVIGCGMSVTSIIPPAPTRWS